MLTTLISAGILLAFALVIFCVIKWWNVRNIGVTPVPLFTFIAILFTSGLDVGLIMFPLAWDFPLYADTAAEPAYAFTNPLALEFGFWGFLLAALLMGIGAVLGRAAEGRLDLGGVLDALRGKRSSV